MTGASDGAAREVEAAIRRLFFYAGFADKYDGAVHATQTRFVTLAMNEPCGVMGIVCPDEAPLLALRLAGRAGDRDGQPRRRRALRRASAGRDRLLLSARHVATCPPAWSTSSPASATRWRKTLAEHDGVDALWYARRPKAATSGRGGLGRQPQGDLDAGRGRRLARRPRAASSCAARRRSRRSGRLTGSKRSARLGERRRARRSRPRGAGRRGRRRA